MASPEVSFFLRNMSISSRQTLSAPPETAIRREVFRFKRCKSEAEFCTSFRIRLASKGRECGVFFDDVFDGRNGLIEFSLFILDDIIIDIRVSEPFLGVIHAFEKIGLVLLNVSRTDTPLKDIQRGVDEYRRYIREKPFDFQNAFPIRLPDTDAIFLFYGPIKLCGGYPIGRAILIDGMFNKNPFFDEGIKGFRGNEIVRVSF